MEQLATQAPERRRHAILNTFVDDVTMDEAVALAEQFIQEGTPVQHVVINASKVNLMRKDEELRKIVNACPMINADGASILLAARLLRVPVRERVTGIDLFLRLSELASRKGYRIYLFGAEEAVLRRTKEVLEGRYPGIHIVGCRNGYFSADDEPQIVADMVQARPDILFVAFSSPKKEFWIHKYLHELQIPFVMGVGGSFDVLAGKTGRAPVWMQRCGLEWFYRFVQEPGRLWKRYIIGNLSFVFYVLQCRLRNTAER